MRSRTSTVALAGALLLASHLAFAHDQRFHPGRATDGEVVSISDDGLVLKTATGTVSVTLSDGTIFEQGDEKVTRESIHDGQRLSVFGTTLASGEIVARTIVIHGPDAHDGHPAAHER